MSDVETTTDLEQMLTVTPEWPCETRDAFHARHGRGDVRYLIHQHCDGCGRTDRHWACEGCAAATEAWVAEGRVVYHGGCFYERPITEFIVSIEAAR